AHLRNGEPVLKPVYRHGDGTIGSPVYLQPGEFVVAEGLLAFHTPELRSSFDIRVFLAPPEVLRRRWKVARDCSRRGYTTDEVLGQRMDFATHRRPQRVGEFTVGTDLHRSDSLGVVQLLILYHLVTARAVLSLGGKTARSVADEAEAPAPLEEPSAR